MQVVALVSQKGGTGKTTLAAGLAVSGERAGLSTVLVDLDPQASAAKWGDLRDAETRSTCRRNPARPGIGAVSTFEQTVETEAMPAGEMRRLVREAVESYLLAGALRAVRIAEESEREWLGLLGEKVDRDGLKAVLTSVGPYLVPPC